MTLPIQLRPRQAAAVARLAQSRLRLQGALQQGSDAGMAGALLGRLVKQHPWAAVALAMGAGGLVSRWQPWRWLFKPELWAALLPPLAAALASAPLGAWAGVLEALLRQSTAAQAEPAAPPPSKNA